MPNFDSRVRFAVIPDRSAILVRARSNVGPIEFGTTRLWGSIEAPAPGPSSLEFDDVTASIEVEVADLTSGNALYDAELRRRVDARIFPRAIVELDEAHALGYGDSIGVGGRLTFHGVTRVVSGLVRVVWPNERLLVVTGEQTIDIRDFDIETPTMLMLKIYPDVQVYLHLEAEAQHDDPDAIPD